MSCSLLHCHNGRGVDESHPDSSAAEDKTTRSLASCCKLCRTGTCWKKNSLEPLRDDSAQMCLVGGLTCLCEEANVGTDTCW